MGRWYFKKEKTQNFESNNNKEFIIDSNDDDYIIDSNDEMLIYFKLRKNSKRRL